MTTPDTTEPTETDEALEELLDAVCNTRVYDNWDAMREAAAPHLAAIRRQAAADALTEQSRSLAKLGAFMRKQASSHVRSGREQTAITYDAMADTYYSSANKLTKAAADKLAEGYEWQCASGTGCCAPVPDAGDLCKDCEANEYDDRWAE